MQPCGGDHTQLERPEPRHSDAMTVATSWAQTYIHAPSAAWSRTKIRPGALVRRPPGMARRNCHGSALVEPARRTDCR